MQTKTSPKSRQWFICAYLLAATLCFYVGCKPSGEIAAQREALLNNEMEQLLIRIADYSYDRTEEAIALANEALSNPKYKAMRPRFFVQKIGLLLMQNKITEASDLVLGAWKSEPEIAREAFGHIHTYYQQRADNKAILEWCRQLENLGSDFPDDLRQQTVSWKLASALAMDDFKTATQYIDQIYQRLRPEQGAPLFMQIFTPLIDAGRNSETRTFINQLKSKKPKSPLYHNLIAALSFRCQLQAGDWDNIMTALNQCVDLLPDNQLLSEIQKACSTFKQKNKTDLLETSCKQVIFNAISKTNSVNYAARTWVMQGIAINKKLLPDRLNVLLNAKVSPVMLGTLFDRYFYDMVNDPDVIRELCAFGDRLLAVCSDAETIASVKIKVLDGSFIVNDLDQTIRMLEAGIPGKDKVWHSMTLSKVKAHRAMLQNKPREAVNYFREFMNAWLASDQEEEFDPSSGIAYSRDWILGRNAKRIATLLESVDEKTEAEKALTEAKAYFTVALKKAADDPEALKLLKEETKGMGL